MNSELRIALQGDPDAQGSLWSPRVLRLSHMPSYLTRISGYQDPIRGARRIMPGCECKQREFVVTSRIPFWGKSVL